MFNPLKRFPLALDINDFSIEAMQLRKVLGKVYLKAYGRVKLPEGIVKNARILKKERLKEKIKELLNNLGPKRLGTKEVIFSLPESKTFLHVFELPFDITGQALKNAIEGEALATIPLDAKELYSDFLVVSKGEKNQEVLYVATKKEVVEDYLQILRDVGLKPLVLDIESASLARAFKNETTEETGMLIIDIGARTTILTVFDEGSIRISSIIPVAGNSFTQTIAKKLNISLLDAERLKRDYGLDTHENEGRIMFILQDVVDDILDKTKKLISFYEKKSQRKINKIIICGGSSLMPKIGSYFSSNLDIETKIGDPSLILPELNEKRYKTFFREGGKDNELHPVLFSNVVGLALRSLSGDPETAGINLIPEKERPDHPVLIKRKLKKNKVFNFSIIAVSIFTFLFFLWVINRYVFSVLK